MSDSLVNINGVSVDINDPCAVLTQLRKAEILVAAGESVSMSRFNRDTTEFTQANLPHLEKLIAQFEVRCNRAQGKRGRYAAQFRFG